MLLCSGFMFMFILTHVYSPGKVDERGCPRVCWLRAKSQEIMGGDGGVMRAKRSRYLVVGFSFFPPSTWYGERESGGEFLYTVL